MNYEIVPCRLAHLRELAATMRADDRAEIEGAGLVVRHALFALWRRTPEPRCALVGGAVAACWGDMGGLLEPAASMWLFTAPAVERVPLAFYREARAAIAELLDRRTALYADVADSYTAAKRFFGMLGFVLGAPATARSGTVYRRMRIERSG